MSRTKFDEVLKNLGVKSEIVRFEKLTRTAVEAAEALGCEVAQIAKSLIFKTKGSDTPLLIITSGVNRVDEKVIAGLGYEIEKADADFVYEKTGYVIGGVPPFGFKSPIKTLFDKDLLKFDEVWAAAGENNAVFKIGTEELIKVTQAEVSAIQ
ncbi:MAG: YbaK/EbsC family protein [Candidatus Shapirobacteria bacterium]|jgi:prolyl-tRNA editing enzyme YbaK/EbsC (Cys-tRNA(Pro) deacylase)